MSKRLSIAVSDLQAESFVSWGCITWVPKHDGASDAFSETTCSLLPDPLQLRLGLLGCCGARQRERQQA